MPNAQRGAINRGNCGETAIVPVDQDMAARLRQARALAGYETPTDAMRALGWKDTYLQHENGTRGFEKHIPKYAAAFRIREDWLRYHRGTPRNGGRVPVVGTIGDFGLVNEKRTKAMDHVDDYVDSPPERGDFLAYRVVGDANYPSLFSGDVIYTAQPGPPDSVIGKHCIARLADGSRRICILARGSAIGLFMVMALNATPMPDIEVIEAAPIVWIKRG